MTAAPIPDALALHELLAAQSAVVAAWQLSVVDRRTARREVGRRRWQRIGRCFVAHNGPLTEEQRLWVAVLHHGPDAALAGLTALQLGGLRGFDAKHIEVLVPRGGPALDHMNGVRRHVTRHFVEDDVHPVRSPRRLRPSPAAVEAAAWAASERQSCAILAATVQQRLVRAADLRVALLRGVRVRRRSLLFATIGDLEGGSHALGEIDALRLCREAGLPEPTRQSVRTDAGGRRRYLDLWWELYRLAVEIDGMQHMEFLNWCDDLLRQNELVIVRGDILRFPSLIIRTHPATFTSQLGRALRSRGWTG